MSIATRRLSVAFKAFFESEKSGGVLLLICTAGSLIVTNSPFGADYAGLWQARIAGLTVEQWINDALMAVFFLLIGLELERELYVGELSDFRNALLPIFAAAGGLCLPALIHFSVNAGTPTQGGFGIPMATDIAFALGALALLGNRVPASLKVFLAALAVMDDLGAIIVIVIFYAGEFSIAYLSGALAVFGSLLALNRVFRVMNLVPYLAGGALMWFLMLKSGVHATIAGVLLAFAIPFTHRQDDEASPSHRLEQFLHKPVAFVILPVFALANTVVVIGADTLSGLATANGLGIIAGLLVGKPLGIFLLSYAAVTAGICRLPLDLSWRHVFGVGILGGIGFTMSIFIANLAFTGEPDTLNASKAAILAASLTAGIAGLLWLRILSRPAPPDHDPDAMEFEIPDSEGD